MIRIACIGLFLLFPVASADAEDASLLAREFAAEQRTMLDAELKQTPILSARPIDEIVRLEISDKQVRFHLLATDAEDGATIPLQGVNGVCQIQRFGMSSVDGPLSVTVHVFDEKRLRAVNVTLSSIASRTGLDILLESPGVSVMTQLVSMEQSPLNGEEIAARLYVQAQREDGIDAERGVALEAETPAELIDQNHAQLIECAAEGLKAVRGMHLLSAMSERQVRHLLVSDARIPAALERQLRDAIAAIAADAESGEATLRAVLERDGPTAAAALSRMSREGWSADLTMRVDTVMAPHLPDDPRVAEAVKTEPARLIDLLYWPDASTREAVVQKLDAITDGPIDFDPQADPYEQADKIEALRAKWAD